jgi:hypothetical protein
MKWAHPLKGRTIKERLAEALTEKLGHEVNPTDLWVQFPALGPEGGARWGWEPNYHYVPREAQRVVSWDTMRDCLRWGFTLPVEGGYLRADSNETETGR